MYRDGRPVDDEFQQSELLFFRCKHDEVLATDQIKPSAVHFPDQSVNREKYSRHRDVLLPDGSPKSEAWILWGVARVYVRDIPTEMKSSGSISYQFTVEHDPQEENYAHSELRVYKNGQREKDKKKINEQIKKAYRTKLALSARVITKPLV
jgi:hypothetical protein